MIQRTTFRNMDVNEALKLLVKKKISNISKCQFIMVQVDVVIQKNIHHLDPENRFTCHLSATDDGGFSADINDKGDSPGKAVTLAFNRLRKSIKRNYRKSHNHYHKRSENRVDVPESKAAEYGKHLNWSSDSIELKM